MRRNEDQGVNYAGKEGSRAVIIDRWPCRFEIRDSARWQKKQANTYPYNRDAGELRSRMLPS
jgi:hypothetical protein